MIEEIKITSLTGRGTLELRRGDHHGYWLGPVDWGQVSGQHQTYSYYNQIGESIVSTTVGARALSITGWVVDASGDTLQSRCDFLNAFFSPAEDYTLEYKGKKIQFRPDISVAYSPEYIKNNEKVRRFLIQGTCPYPLFTDSQDTEVIFDFSRKLFRFPTGFGRRTPLVFAATSKAYNVEIENKGGFSTGLIAVIRFSGEVVNPKLRNLTTDKFSGVNRTFTRHEQLEISTLPGSKHMTLYTAGGGQENVIKYRDYRGNWIQLVPGANLLALDCDDLDQRPNMDVTVYFTPLYLEVE